MSVSCSVMFDSLPFHGLQPALLLCAWHSPSKNTGVGCHSLLQGIFLTQGSNPRLLPCTQILYQGSRVGDSSAHYSCASLISLVGKEPACNVGDPGLIPGLGRSLREGKGYPLQYSDLSPWGPKELDATELLSLSQLESHWSKTTFWSFQESFFKSG